MQCRPDLSLRSGVDPTHGAHDPGAGRRYPHFSLYPDDYWDRRRARDGADSGPMCGRMILATSAITGTTTEFPNCR